MQAREAARLPAVPALCAGALVSAGADQQDVALRDGDSVAMLGGFEFFREFAQYRMLVFGLAMVAIMIWRPRGLIATRVPSVFLKERKMVAAELVEEARK